VAEGDHVARGAAAWHVERGLKKGVATLCIGGGEATAVALEVL
jgi:acetyl-CoA acetyltransferase